VQLHQPRVRPSLDLANAAALRQREWLGRTGPLFPGPRSRSVQHRVKLQSSIMLGFVSFNSLFCGSVPTRNA